MRLISDNTAVEPCNGPVRTIRYSPNGQDALDISIKNRDTNTSLNVARLDSNPDIPENLFTFYISERGTITIFNENIPLYVMDDAGYTMIPPQEMSDEEQEAIILKNASNISATLRETKERLTLAIDDNEAKCVAESALWY